MTNAHATELLIQSWLALLCSEPLIVYRRTLLSLFASRISIVFRRRTLSLNILIELRAAV